MLAPGLHAVCAFVVAVAALYLAVVMGLGLGANHPLAALAARGSGTNMAVRAVAVVVGLAALALALQRDFYLPFLGPCAFPPGLLPKRPTAPENSSVSVIVKVPPQSRVIYWASEASKTGTPPPDGAAAVLPGPADVYGPGTNTGVAVADAQGRAVLFVKRPVPYAVGVLKRRLEPHVHYRVLDSKEGMYGPVRTAVVPPANASVVLGVKAAST